MEKTSNAVSFFFGANNKVRYCSLFDELYNPFEEGNHIILKGGPGTGKSTLMKKIAAKLEKKNLFVERGFCSADPESLDVVIASEIGFSVFDGTAPHTADPKMPGVGEHIVDLGVAWNRKKLKSHAKEIAELTQANSLQHKKVADLIYIASQLENGNRAVCFGFTDRDKLERYMRRLAYRLIPERKNVEPGRIKKRFLSAITPVGVSVQYDTITRLCERTVTVEDAYSAVSPLIISYISTYATENGYDVYECFCPLFPWSKPEHIIIPELKLSVFTQNDCHFSIDDGERLIHASRFFLKDGYAAAKEKLNFAKKAKKEFIDEAVNKLSYAGKIHDKLEEYYIDATDFGVIDELSEEISGLI